MPLVHQALVYSFFYILYVQTFLALRLLEKRIDLVLASPNWILSPLFRNVVKWSGTLQKSCSICSKIEPFSNFCNVSMLVHKVWASGPWIERWETYLISFTFTRLYFKSPSEVMLDSTWNLLKLNPLSADFTKWWNTLK